MPIRHKDYLLVTLILLFGALFARADQALVVSDVLTKKQAEKLEGTTKTPEDHAKPQPTPFGLIRSRFEAIDQGA